MAPGLRSRSASGLIPDVAIAMLHVRDLAWLAESPLCELSQVRERARGSLTLFAEGIALQQRLEAATLAVLDRLPSGDRRLDRIRFTLEGVLQGSSIAALAREQGHTREYWSRSVWREAAALVARELVAQEKARVTA